LTRGSPEEVPPARRRDRQHLPESAGKVRLASLWSAPSPASPPANKPRCPRSRNVPACRC